MRKTKLFFALVSFMLCVCAKAEIIKFGSCGKNVTYTLDDSGLLVIEGSGDMADYEWDGFAPWYSQRLNINQVEIKNGVTSIEYAAFSGCSGLTSITIPNSVTSIQNYAFSGCSGLTSIIIPNSVTSIGDCAFYDCKRLTSITIPNSVTSIGAYAFARCSGLTSIIIPNSITSIESAAFSDCSGLTSITIPNSVTSIGERAFSNCSRLASITIPISATSIGERAFSDCSGLTSVTISNSVTSFGKEVFYNCYKINTINVLCTTPPSISKDIFKCSTSYVRNEYEIYTYANLHVPMGCKEIYSAAYEWRYFNKIKEDREMDGKVYYAKLAVKQGTTGYTEHDVKADEPYTIFIGSIGNNHINTVIFNGKDVTDELVNGYYTTPEIKKNSTLSVTYETEASEVKSLMLNNVKVYGSEGCINVNNIDEPASVKVFTSDGRLLNTQENVVGSTSFNVVEGGVYMVKVGARSFKLAI